MSKLGKPFQINSLPPVPKKPRKSRKKPSKEEVAERKRAEEDLRKVKDMFERMVNDMSKTEKPFVVGDDTVSS